ncbi:methyltransferase type 11 [Alteromonas sp. MB-3u-76]|uniref:class I SAM-dependent methyltransferase n=1 Tax=Alteromonas sp. MB-3u-76 TaxID=2058133 RepID=UPI000C30D8F9|nr:class I SAM-dependent methyltransferase [Alteromonas sp. MB-3u-76]AUC87640.1 methyltransferase type 11 [Alteromonas sp. MB-3u-76]
MERKCFLCQSELEKIYNHQWVLPGIATSTIGFSVCPSCGSVSQSPSVSFDDMMAYYETVAVYTNPGREELPSAAKVRDLDEQINFIKRGIGKLPDKVLQIGSSDGYTLSRFRAAGVKRVLGVEPSIASVDIAKRLYDVESIRTTAENFDTKEEFSLILMTHVLEHFYAPQEVLKKCFSLQEKLDDGYIYIEVPLLTHEDSMCPGFFSFEHINYYTKGNLTRSLEEVGYYPISVIEHYQSNLSPVIGILASNNKPRHYLADNNEYQENKRILASYRKKEIEQWQSKLDVIQPTLESAERLILWGAGIHTTQLLANTNLLKSKAVNDIVDSSKLKWGIKQGDWVCKNPNHIDWQEGDAVIISSYASEQEIFDSLQWLRDKGVKTLRLHNIVDSKAH